MKKPIEGNTTVRLLAPAVPGLAEALIGPWTARARCAETDPEIFFPPADDPATEARHICAQCPVREDCLAYALDADERFGIWGGLDPRERQHLRRQQRTARTAGKRKGAA
jgi:WhiB family transcriptional regulator, redox-sensing transcriptional regulator